MSDSKTLNIDLCKDPDGALSRWLWAAHEGQPHDARASVSLSSTDAERLRRWIESHPLVEGRTIEIHESEEPKTMVLWTRYDDIEDRRRYQHPSVQLIMFDRVADISLIIDDLYDVRIEEGRIRAAKIRLDSYRPVDEFADYLPSMEEKVIDWALDPESFTGNQINDPDSEYVYTEDEVRESDEVRNAARVLALAAPHSEWKSMEVEVEFKFEFEAAE